jgi:hypothetical protein
MRKSDFLNEPEIEGLARRTPSTALQVRFAQNDIMKLPLINGRWIKAI